MVLLSTETGTVIKENKNISENIEYLSVFLWIQVWI